jgi:hypothetical protein
MISTRISLIGHLQLPSASLLATKSRRSETLHATVPAMVIFRAPHPTDPSG